MLPVAILTCLENKTELHPGSDFKENIYTVKMAVLFKTAEKPPAIRGQLTLESDRPLPYHPGKKYNIRLAEDAGLVIAGSVPDGIPAPGGEA